MANVSINGSNIPFSTVLFDYCWNGELLTGLGAYIQAWTHPKNFLDFEFGGFYEWPMDTESIDSQVDPPGPPRGQGHPFWV